MIIKINNQSKDFYNIMGKFFGSRIVENKTNDRIYDDNNKEWYIYLNNNTPVAFVSIASNVMKNVYAVEDEFLVELLNHISKEIKIKDSVVTNVYSDIYNTCGFITTDSNGYKNFIKIRSDINE